MAGLPGSGKTTLARALAATVGGVVINKDEVRAALFPGELTDYSGDQDNLCITAIVHAAEYLATRDRLPFVFFDGRTFSRSHQVEQVIRAAEECGAGWKILHLTVPDEVARERLHDAEAAGHPAKNRDFNLYREVQARSEPITRPKLDVDTSQPLEDCVQKCKAYLLAR